GFFGSINTMGGVEGGNGGFVETSSKNNLQSFGQVQASAPKGRAGEWLLDPYNVTISSQGPSTGGGFNGQNPDIFTPTANNANIFNGDINRALDAGTSVTVTTGPSKTVPPGVEPAGNITVAANITKSKDTPPDAPDVVFRLQAANDIIVNGGITISSTAGNLGIELLADYDNTGVGRVDLRDNVTLASNSGNIVLQSATGLSVGTDVSIDATLSLATANAIWGGQRFSGDVTIRPSSTTVPTTVGVGGGTGSLQITQAIVDAITLLDPTSVTTARAGTLYLGSTSSGQMTLGTIDGPNGLAVNLQLSAGRTLQTGVLQGIVQDSSGLGAGAGAGMVILKSTGTIGTSGTAVKVRTGQLGVLTDGSLINVSSDQSLTRLYVETAGATPNQIITDGGNLNYDVVEQSLTATIGGVSGFYVNSGSIDFSYINTGGGITVGAAGRMATPTGWLSGIPFGILATQDPNANGGQGVAATPGKVTLKANGALTMTAAPAPSPVVSSGITDAILATSGGIFTGGGDLNIEASDFVSPNVSAYYQFFYTAGDPPPPSGYLGQLLGPQSGPALNTFVPVQSGAGGAGVWDFGLRQLLAFYGDPANGQISGQGGVLSLTSTANIYGPGGITISDGSLSNVFSISTPETFGMEANVIQIGSATSGNLDLLTHDLVFGFVNTVWGRNGGVDFTDTYTPRYFENPYNGYGLDGRDVNTVPRNNDYRPVPHVANGLVHLISGTGAIQLAEGGDVNVTTLGGTSINGVDFLGNNGGAVNTNYAGSNTINNTIYSVGSLIYNLTGRVGRTILDTQITQAASFNAYFDVTGLGTAPTGFFVGDSTDAVRGVAIMGSDVSGTLSVNSIQLDQPSYFVNPNPYRGGQTAVGLGGFTGTAQVLIGPPDLPTGTPAVGSATVVSGRVTGINVDTPGSGYLKPPAVVVVMPKTSGGDTGVGGQQATGIALLSGGQVTGVTPVTANSSSILGGGRYSSTPEVTLVGGGIALGGARAVLNDFGQLGTVAAVQSGLGYTTAPTVSISGGGGTGAIVDAVINNRGELTPYNITFGGSGYKTTPTVVITDPTGSGAVARPIMGGQPGNLTLLGIMPVTGGSGYSNPTIEIIGGDPTQSATATALTGLSILNSFNIRNPGAGYISEPTVTLSGGGIELAQARPYVDLNPLSGNYGRVTAYELANPGSGYKNAPSVVVGVGGANGQSGEVGVSTDPVDS
ncbi:hypothetical protein EBX31_08805, partial [bacterium]|nr:hypothetical protein [bacterium]